MNIDERLRQALLTLPEGSNHLNIPDHLAEAANTTLEYAKEWYFTWVGNQGDAIILSEDQIHQDSASAEDFDPINPSHYNAGGDGIECIDAIHEALGDDGFHGYLRGNIIKYVWRLGKKGSPLEQAQKAQWYIETLCASLESQEETRSDLDSL